MIELEDDIATLRDAILIADREGLSRLGLAALEAFTILTERQERHELRERERDEGVSENKMHGNYRAEAWW